MLSSQNIFHNHINLENPRYLTKQDFEQENKRTDVSANDVLLTIVGTVGRVAVVSPDLPKLTLQRSVAVLKPNTEYINSRFLMYSLQNISDYLTTESRGVAQKGIYLKQIRELKIPLPPLAEQQKIAAILDAADSLRQKDQQLVERYTALSQSLFLEMFGDPVTNPKQLKKTTLDKIIKLKSGDFLPASLMVSNGKYPVFGGNGINGYHDQFMFDTEKIIIGRVGVYCGCVHVSPPNSWVTDNALYVSEYDPEVNFDYLAYSLYQANLNQYASKSAQPLISGARLYPVEILLPELKRQSQFAENMNVVKAQKQQAQRSLEKSEALFNSLLQWAFTGELTAKMAA